MRTMLKDGGVVSGEAKIIAGVAGSLVASLFQFAGEASFPSRRD